jgi:hypothetical protein
LKQACGEGLCAPPVCRQQLNRLCCDLLLQIFPFFPAPGGENAGLTECARQHLAVRPKKGDGERGARKRACLGCTAEQLVL